jgi:hypothetical protein
MSYPGRDAEFTFLHIFFHLGIAIDDERKDYYKKENNFFHISGTK